MVKRGKYYDSVLLLRVSQRAQGFPGVKDAAVVMGTDANKEILKELGLNSEELGSAGPDDLVISIEANEDVLDDAFAKVEEELTSRRKAIEKEYYPKSIETALSVTPDANLLSIAIPGKHVYREAKLGLSHGLNLFIFSSNVPLEHEKELKEMGREKGLLVMGPDCGTSIIGGKVLGFGNVVEKGPVGIVAASGSGTQEITCLMQRMGVGITHAIGTGGNDLHEKIGGTTMIQAIDLLEEDPDTEIILLVSKPPNPKVEEIVLKHLDSSTSKPVIINFLGGDPQRIEERGYTWAKLLDQAAVLTVNHVRGEGYSERFYKWDMDALVSMAESEWSRLSEAQRYVRGLYAGGSLATEAQVVLRPIIGDAYSNSPLNSEYKLVGHSESRYHNFVDLGAEEYVEGRPHPIIDPTQRKLRIEKEARDPETAVILLDVILGYGAHDDPAGALTSAIESAKNHVKAVGGHLSVVASITGTARDLQDYGGQVKKLEEVGVLVLPSNAQAAAVAGMIATRKETSIPWRVD